MNIHHVGDFSCVIFVSVSIYILIQEWINYEWLCWFSNWRPRKMDKSIKWLIIIMLSFFALCMIMGSSCTVFLPPFCIILFFTIRISVCIEHLFILSLIFCIPVSHLSCLPSPFIHIYINNFLAQFLPPSMPVSHSCKLPVPTSAPITSSPLGCSYLGSW